jgi:hypothetical protein
MAFEPPGAGALNYFPCRYGTSRLVFRGPARRIDGAYCAILGGTETYGKFVEHPFPDLLEGMLGVTVVNFGCMHAGIDAFLEDEAILEACDGARVVVVQVMGAHNMSNRFYTVHPRRNDRFLRATPELRAMCRRIDFTEFNFTRHLLSALQMRAPDAFARVADELRAVWVDRMGRLLHRLRGRAVLLWVSGHAADAARAVLDPSGDPVLVDRAMLEAVRPLAAELVEVVISPAARARGTEGMRFGPLEAPAAEGVPSCAAHAEVAEALSGVVRRRLG